MATRRTTLGYLSARGLGFYIGFVFLGFGSTIFAYLLFKSRYIPRVLAAWGIFSSSLLAIGSLAVILFHGSRITLRWPT